ncbi:hypothetical protein SETIT_2G380100v2 [Setaria italica]|uniref:Uncharacterized protein n=1 Tax=Setaria italica TaxID=4555 RepID=A0A368Q759_SETIT|nr:hypothetical protein SETIT_2G380100v2 [Setaria italica]
MMGSALGREARAAMVADPPLALANNVELPADLCCLRLVRRSWRSLTSDTRFARAHSSRHPLIAGLRRHQDEIHVIDVYSGSIAKRIRGLGITPLDCEVKTLIAGNGGDQSWRARPHSPVCVSLDFWKIAVVDGVVYFLLDGFSIDDFPDDEHGSIASFDLATEEWAPIHRLLGNIQLAKLNGCLVMIHHADQYCSMDLWFLQEKINKESWTKQYTVQYTTSLSNCLLFNFPYPLVVLDDGRMVVWFGKARALRSYNPILSTWEDLGVLEDYVPVSMYEGSLLRSGLQVDP